MLRARTPRTFLWYLVVFGCALGLPLAIYAGLLSVRLAQQERDGLERLVHDTAREVLVGLDRELAGHVSALRALATSSGLHERDLSEFYMEALRLTYAGGVTVSLRDLEGRQLLNTRVPWGTMLATVPLDDTDRRVIATRRPAVSDLSVSPVTGEPQVLVSVPVAVGEEVERLLHAALDLPRLASLFGARALQKPFYVSITDRQGRIVVRASDQERFLGKRLPGFDELRGEAGTWSGTNLHGVPVFGAWRRSAETGYLVGVGIERAALTAPFLKSGSMLAALGALLALLGAVIAFRTSRVLSSTMWGLARAAEGLGRGPAGAPPPGALTLVEGAAIARAMSRAEEELSARNAALEENRRELEARVAERTRALAEKSALLNATLENMDQGLMMIDGDGVVQVCNERTMALLDLPPDLMRAKPTFAAVLEHQIESGEFDRADPTLRAFVANGGLAGDFRTYERTRPNGMVIEIRTVPLLGGGAVRTYADVTERKRAEAEIEHLARHDPLTTLPNRLLFRERLNQALARQRRYGGSVAVLCLDLDRFKPVNDTLGHPVGDALLKIVADRIRTTLRTEDTVARLGGDEFAVIQVCEAAQPEAAAALARRLVQILGEPVLVEGGHRLTVGVSIGAAIAPLDGTEPDQLMKSADLALYRAKDEGRNTFRFYEAAMDEAVEERQRLEVDLRGALGRGEFELHYQPILAVERNRIVGFEALLRWRHPERGLVPPSAFIPLAEETGLVVPIGEWVLRAACAEAARWPGDLRVAVNISAVQFAQAGLAQTVLAALAAAGLPPQRLELEITETVLMNDSDAVLAALHGLRSLGIRVALDDFGTGYSSLSYLRRFPFDRIKIDRSFVAGIADPDTAAIVRAIVGLGLRLGSVVTAEGVETPEQYDLVVAEGCAEIQGYLISPPLPPAAAVQLLRVASAA